MIRVRRILLTATVLGILALTPWASASTPAVPVGIVTVEADFHTPEKECLMEGPTLPCPISWDNNGTMSVGDDELVASVFVDEARVTADIPGDVAPTSFAFQPRDIVIEHPVYGEVNRTWIALNESRPWFAESVVAFESRP